MISERRAALAVFVVFLTFAGVVWVIGRSLESAGAYDASPVFVPHIASDCRAACTLEGMELAGVELGASDGRATCLCAPVSP